MCLVAVDVVGFVVVFVSRNSCCCCCCSFVALDDFKTGTNDCPTQDVVAGGTSGLVGLVAGWAEVWHFVAFFTAGEVFGLCFVVGGSHSDSDSDSDSDEGSDEDTFTPLFPVPLTSFVCCPLPRLLLVSVGLNLTSRVSFS